MIQFVKCYKATIHRQTTIFNPETCSAASVHSTTLIPDFESRDEANFYGGVALGNAYAQEKQLDQGCHVWLTIEEAFVIKDDD